MELEYVQRLSRLFRARHIPDLSIYGIFEGYFYKFFDIFRDFRYLKGMSTLAYVIKLNPDICEIVKR